MRSKRGITLVSLVVTIIVLIILAGVSINLTIGENGIITIAKKARENMELATIEEETRLNALYTQIELEDGNIGGIDNSSISKLIEFKRKVASAITDMGIETLETATADTMANNIRSISTNKDASSINYDNTNSGLSATNVQGAVDELNNSLNNLNGISDSIYSTTEEIKIGTWIDGKPLYRKVLVLPTTINTTAYTGSGYNYTNSELSKMDKIIRFSAIKEDGYTDFDFNHTSGTSTIRLTNVSNWSALTHFIVEYTRL